MAITFLKRNHPNIKGGGVDFLIIILVGLILNMIYVERKKNINCNFVF